MGVANGKRWLEHSSARITAKSGRQNRSPYKKHAVVEMTFRAFTLPENNNAVRDSVLNNVLEFVKSHPIDQRLQITVQDHEESRRDIQNRLMWAWHNEYGKHMGHTPDHMHAEIKMTILLPLLRGWDKHSNRAKVIDFVLDSIDKYEHKLFIAYDMIRSSDLNITQFAEFLSAYQRYAAEQGCVLSGREDDLLAAMGERHAV